MFEIFPQLQSDISFARDFPRNLTGNEDKKTVKKQIDNNFPLSIPFYKITKIVHAF